MAPRSSPGPVEIVFKSFAAIAGAVLGIWLLWGIRGLIVPVAVGGLLAYICHPLVTGLERHRLPRGPAIGLLLLAFVSAALLLVIVVRAAVPTGIGALDFKTRALHKINQRYKSLMGLDSSPSGNRIYQLAHDDVDPIVDRINRLLTMTPEERATFLDAHTRRADRPADDDADAGALLDYDRFNLQELEQRGLSGGDGGVEGMPRSSGSSVDRRPARPVKTRLAALAGILSTWVVAPTVFLFLLRDTGEIKRGFLRLIPNRLFEPTMAVLADLDGALGSYLRGVFLECSLLGLALALLFAAVGIPILWAIALGFLAGATNVIPYVGSAVALLVGLSYTLVAQEIHPLLPMIHADDVAIWLVVGVLLVEVLKNVVVEPLVLGGAGRLHPLVVVIGVLGGGILFGLPGLLLAVPTITIVKAFVSSASTQLKAYGLV
jgi:predicted PurR-regulated permease PerM